MKLRVMCCLYALLIGIGLTAGPASAEFYGMEYSSPQPARDFVLKAPDGSDFRLSKQRGQVVVLSFGYTFCPDVCPATLVELAQVRAILGEVAKRMRVLFITLDPERDTPERLGIYTRAFDPTFLGLTGTPSQLAQVREAYGVTATQEVVAGTAAAYLTAHSAYTYVVDPEGRLRLVFPFGMAVEEMVHDIKRLLRR
jgi:protein SCO1/2